MSDMIFFFQLRPILTDLDFYWPDLQNPDTKQYLWKHESEQHGRCSSSVLDLYAYFVNASRFSYMNVGKILNEGGKGIHFLFVKLSDLLS